VTITLTECATAVNQILKNATAVLDFKAQVTAFSEMNTTYYVLNHNSYYGPLLRKLSIIVR
jgi:hypothetical protein